jgi:mannan endo-1,4-beta-mannosidase
VVALRYAGAGAALVLLLADGGAAVDRQRPRAGREFVQSAGRALAVRGEDFRVVGASNYYLMYKSPLMVDAVLESAAASGFNVIRTWGSLEIGNQDGSNSVRGKAEGVYFQYWGGTAPAFNDGPDGLQRLDYVVAKAGNLGLRLVIPFVNNWNDFGGMDQYVRWRGGRYHDDFFTDPLIRTWFKAWIAHVLNRVNSITGVAYKDDPTIMVWELANEPRCLSGGAYPRSSTCSTQTLIDWAADMSAYVKTLDANHLVSVGDEGFYCRPGADDWTENCGEGVDTLRLADLPHVDVASLHLYPESWGKTPEWGTEWITRHLLHARALRERPFLGEFGLRDKTLRNRVYLRWMNAVVAAGGAGATYWMLADVQDNGTPYPDFDGFTVYCPSPVCTTLGNFAKLIGPVDPASFAPVADHDSTRVEHGAAATVPVTTNDVAFGGVPLLRESVDLDPETPQFQRSRTTSAGTFAVRRRGVIEFTPSAGFSGAATAPYVVYDMKGRASNAASLTIDVRPPAGAPLVLFSFESGTDGWAPASWQPAAGSMAQSPEHASEGSYSLEVRTVEPGWFGVVFTEPADFGDRTTLLFDLQTTTRGTLRSVALQVGDGWQWCQGASGHVGPDTGETVTFELDTLDCGVSDWTGVRALYVWLDAGGTFYIDDVRVE